MNKSLLFSRLYAIGLFMLFSSGWALGQTVLNSGDIAITGVNMDNPDEISVVFLVDIEIGTEIKFTDKGWKVDNTWRISEGIHTWTASQAYSAGDEIVITLDGPLLAGLGDQVIAFQNTSDMVAAINDDGDHIWQSDATSSNTSALPQGLTNGVNCVALTETDNIIYNRSVITGTKAEILSAINDYTNWSGNNTTRQVLSTAGFSITATPINNWNGNGDTDTDWATSANWSQGVVPTVNHNVKIPSGLTNNPIISAITSAECYDLSLEGTATLNIISNLTNSGSLILGGNYTVGTGNVTYQRHMVGSQWHMLGSPLSGQTLYTDFLANAANSITTDGTNYSMKHYIESPEAWSSDYTSATTESFTLGKGYATMRSADGMFSLTGSLNNSTVNVPITQGVGGYGWNLLSNPFTSAIAANNDGGADNLIANNTAALDDSYEAVYIWDGSTYVIINHASPATPSATLVQNYLQTGQGFFVKSADPAAGTFTITPAMQSHQTAIAFKSTEESSWASISLNAEISNAKSSTSILYRNDMNRSLDIGYDAGVLKSGSLVLYSRLINDNGIDFGVQCLPEDYDNLIVPIGLDAIAGEIVTFTAKSLNIPEDYAVVLEDRAMNTFIDLSDEGEYIVQLDNASEGTGRFFVRTSLKSALGIGDIEKETFLVFTRVNDHQLVIRGEVKQNTSARIYSITGQLMTEAVLEQSVENRIPFDGTTGIYLVRITSKEGATTHKFTWAN